MAWEEDLRVHSLPLPYPTPYPMTSSWRKQKWDASSLLADKKKTPMQVLGDLVMAQAAADAEANDTHVDVEAMNLAAILDQHMHMVKDESTGVRLRFPLGRDVHFGPTLAKLAYQHSTEPSLPKRYDVVLRKAHQQLDGTLTHKLHPDDVNQTAQLALPIILGAEVPLPEKDIGIIEPHVRADNAIEATKLVGFCTQTCSDMFGFRAGNPCQLRLASLGARVNYLATRVPNVLLAALRNLGLWGEQSCERTAGSQCPLLLFALGASLPPLSPQ